MNGGPRAGFKAALEAWFNRVWWQAPSTAQATLLRPLSWLYLLLLKSNGWLRRLGGAVPQTLPVPVLVVGNWVVGGAGKTPTVMAVVQALQRRGHRPGVISRGHGRVDSRAGGGAQEVRLNTAAHVSGDEPLLIRRRCGVPVWVGARRVAAAAALCQAHPEVDVLVSDDGLQHHALPRAAELVVFDERGVGNACLLPAGPLRQPLPASLPAWTRVLYTSGHPSTALQGAVARRSIDIAWPLAAWQSGRPDLLAQALPLAALQGQALLAVAGIAAPEKFFSMLESAGLTIERLSLPDHHDYANLPWPHGTAVVITTEKDAIKLDPQRMGSTAVWVVPLNLTLPDDLIADLHNLLFPMARP